jgi:hypothetical protein
MMWSLGLVEFQTNGYLVDRSSIFRGGLPSGGLLDPTIVYTLAIIAASSAAALLAGTLFALRPGRLTVGPPGAAGVPYELIEEAKGKLVVASIPFLASVGLGVLAAFLLLVFGLSVMSWIMVVWLGSSVSLLVGSKLFSSISRLRSDDWKINLSLHGSWILDYAIANLAGLGILVLSLVLEWTPIPAQSQVALPIARLLDTLGVFSQLLAVPLLGVIIFATISVQGISLALERPLERPSLQRATQPDVAEASATSTVSLESARAPSLAAFTPRTRAPSGAVLGEAAVGTGATWPSSVGTAAEDLGVEAMSEQGTTPAQAFDRRLRSLERRVGEHQTMLDRMGAHALQGAFENPPVAVPDVPVENPPGGPPSGASKEQRPSGDRRSEPSSNP